MKRIDTPLEGCFIIEPKVFGDQRGFFFESFNQKVFSEITGVHTPFVQDNHSKSTKGVLRGLHFQIKHAQGKLVRVIRGEVVDSVVDLRKSSKTFGKSFTIVLSEENKKQLWIPPGFAHGFLVKSDVAEFVYKTTDYYHPEFERTLMWNDPSLNIDWQIDYSPQLSEKDQKGKCLSEVETYP